MDISPPVRQEDDHWILQNLRNFPSLQLSGSSPSDEAEGGRAAGGGWRLRSLTEFSLRPFYLVRPQPGQGQAGPSQHTERQELRQLIPGIYLLNNR